MAGHNGLTRPQGQGLEGLTVAVTGAGGYLGSRLVESLCAEEGVARVVGFDIRPPSFTDPRFVFDRLDVRDPALEARFKGVDVLVHLAFIMDPIQDEAEMRDVNVNGSQNVFRCAGRAGVSKVVYTSSAVAYGAHPDNDVPLTEDSPLRANLDFSYAAHKLEVEYVVREINDEFPDLRFTIFRPAIVFGPHVDNAWSHQLQQPIPLRVRGQDAPLQFVHEDDVAAALRTAVITDLEGVFNLAPEGWLELDEIAEITGRRGIEIPEATAFSLIDRMWSLGWSEAPSGMLHYVLHPWVVSSEKLRKTGFTFSRTNREALEETWRTVGERVRFGANSYDRGDLVKGAAIAAGLGIALVSLRTAKRRLSRTH